MADQETAPNIKYDAEGNRYRYNYATGEFSRIGEDFGVGATLLEGAKNAVTRAGGGILQLGAGFGDAMGNPNAGPALENIERNVASSDEALRLAGGDVYKGASLAGQALPYAAAGAATGGMGVPGMLATEAALGGMSYGTPTERAIGALAGAGGGALGAGVGAAGRGAYRLARPGAATAVPGTMANRVSNGIVQASDDIDGAASGGLNLGSVRSDVGPGGPSGAGELGEALQVRNKLTSRMFPGESPNVELNRMADDAGIKLTEGQRRGNVGQQQFEEAATRNPGGQDVFNREFLDPNTAKTTSNVREAMGLEPGDKITFADRELADAQIADSFNKLRDIPGSYKIMEDDIIQLRNMTNVAKNADITSKINRQYIDNMAKRIGGETPESELPFGAEVRMQSADIIDTVRDLNDGIRNAKFDTERQVLQEMRTFWEGKLERMAHESGNAEIISDWKVANEQFRVKKLLESPGVWKGDEISIKSLANQAGRQFQDAMMGNTYKDGRGRIFEPATTRLIKNLQVLRSFPATVGNSGTPTGLLFQEGPGKAMQKVLSGRVGAEALFGSPLRAAGAGGLNAARWAAQSVIPGL